MFNKVHVAENIREIIRKNQIDLDLTLRILNDYNNGVYADVKPLKVKNLPDSDGKRIIDMTSPNDFTVSLESAEEQIREISGDINIRKMGTVEGKTLVFSREQLAALGELLFPYVSYGVFNGGSASSYIDGKRNRGFDERLFNSVEEPFSRMAGASAGKSKGAAPAYMNPDGTAGAAYLELKMRALLVKALRYQKRFGKEASPLFPMFQMTNIKNDAEIRGVYAGYRSSTLLDGLISATGLDITRVRTGVQPLIAAYTHSEEGDPKFIFTSAYGEKDRVLPLPGGHGQCFFVLRDVFKELFAMGKRFVLLGNVDNLGNLPNPETLAVLALSGKPAGFEFAHKTPVDVKGGILITDTNGRLNCADIGPAISADDVAEQQKSGKQVLFNCATGLFRLDYLTDNAAAVSKNLPMRFSDQNKDAGRYSQAEQITWEVLGLLDDFLVFAVSKYDRFLAAKILLENLLTSGIGLDAVESETMRKVGTGLHWGLNRLLVHEYGMSLEKGKWVPLAAEDL